MLVVTSTIFVQEKRKSSFYYFLFKIYLTINKLLELFTFGVGFRFFKYSPPPLSFLPSPLRVLRKTSSVDGLKVCKNKMFNHYSSEECYIDNQNRYTCKGPCRRKPEDQNMLWENKLLGVPRIRQVAKYFRFCYRFIYQSMTVCKYDFKSTVLKS